MARRMGGSGNIDPTKTTGFTGIMLALPDMLQKGKDKGEFTTQFVGSIFERTRALLEADRKQLTGADFPSAGASHTKLRDYIVAATNAM